MVEVVPLRLYKYVSKDGLARIVGPGRIRYSQPAVLNDPFEFTVHRPELFSAKFVDKELESAKVSSIFDDTIKKMKAEHPMLAGLIDRIPLSEQEKIKVGLRSQVDDVAQQLLPKVSAALNERMASEFRILSLTETPINLLMWAHYADSHKGAVIEFDTSHAALKSPRSATDELRYPRKVLYVDHMPKASLDQTNAEVLFLTKGKPWAYEKEWRILQAARFAVATSGEQPTEICLYEMPHSAVTSVTFGAGANADWVQSEIARIHALPDASHVEYFQCQVSSQDYELVRLPISSRP